MTDRVVSYTPTPTLATFHASNAFVRGIRGPIGSGKSVGMCWEIYTRAMEQAKAPDGVRRSRWLITRNTYGELTTTTLKTWLDWFPEDVCGRVVHGAPITQMCKFTHADGSRVDLEVWFLALDRPDHVKKLLSMEVTGAWMNEAKEQPKAILDALTGRVGRYPSQRDGGPTWYGVILDTNSPDADHWWYKLAEETRSPDYLFLSQPGGDTAEAENVANLPQGYYQRLLTGKTDEWIKGFVKGQYGFVMDGKPVYPEFIDNIHVGSVAYNPNLPVFAGIDFGLTPAATFMQRGHFGHLGVFDELVTEDMGAVRFSGLFRDKMATYKITQATSTGDPAGDSRAQTDEKTAFQILAAEGVIASPAHTNDFSLRREAVVRPMSRLIDGRPGLLIDPRCRMLRKAMAGGYCYRRLKVTGEEKFHDVPDKGMYSHVAESLQYNCLGVGEGREVIRSATIQNRNGPAIGADDPIFG